MTKTLNVQMNGKNRLVLKIRNFYFIKWFFLTPANEVSSKVMFFLMFICSQVGGSAYTRGVGWSDTPPRNQKSGQYASYWNAFVLLKIFTYVCTVLLYIEYQKHTLQKPYNSLVDKLTPSKSLQDCNHWFRHMV